MFLKSHLNWPPFSTNARCKSVLKAEQAFSEDHQLILIGKCTYITKYINEIGLNICGSFSFISFYLYDIVIKHFLQSQSKRCHRYLFLVSFS